MTPESPLYYLPFQDDPDVHQLLDLMRSTELRIAVLTGMKPYLRLVNTAKTPEQT